MYSNSVNVCKSHSSSLADLEWALYSSHPAVYQDRMMVVMLHSSSALYSYTSSSCNCFWSSAGSHYVPLQYSSISFWLTPFECLLLNSTLYECMRLRSFTSIFTFFFQRFLTQRISIKTTTYFSRMVSQSWLQHLFYLLYFIFHQKWDCDIEWKFVMDITLY